MNRYICNNCLTKDYDIERKEGTQYPIMMVLGGIIGGIVAATVGWVAIPAGLMAGLGLDLVRCDVCGSDKNLYKFMVDEEDEWGEKVYKPIPPPVDDSKHYRYDELEERFMPVDAKDESTSTLGIETPFHDFPDYDFSFDSPDTSFQIGSFDFDFGGSSESAGSSGAGDGGDLGAGSGGEAGGGNGGGK